MTTPPIRLPSGVRDFLPRAAARRRSLAASVLDVFEAWGYARIITPVFECADVLERGLGADARAAAIRFVEPGTGEVVALRPDITPQIARVVATRMADVAGPIRLCYEGAVTRLAGERGQREILQAGIELDRRARARRRCRGARGRRGGARARSSCPRSGSTSVTSRRRAFVLGAAPDAGARARLARRARAQGSRGAARARRARCPTAIAPLAEALATLWGPAADDARRARARCRGPRRCARRSTQLRAVLARVRRARRAAARRASRSISATCAASTTTPACASPAYAGGAPDAVLRGGRYDELLGRYGRAARATGFAIDLEAVAQAQRAIGVAPPVAARRRRRRTGRGAARLARALRARGLRAVDRRRALPRAGAAWLRGAGLDAARSIGDRADRRSTTPRDRRRRDRAAPGGRHCAR